jgi:hypothetical protein
MWRVELAQIPDLQALRQALELPGQRFRFCVRQRTEMR